VKVWDALVRVAHWTLAACVIGAWFTRDDIHEWLGYATLGVVALRVVWGFAGPRYARFAQFVRPLADTLAYARAAMAGRGARYLGHNPLGGWMIVSLLAMVALTAGSGWLSVSERYWGVAWLQEGHALLADALGALVLLHLAGVVHASVRHRENLAAAMITGAKTAPRPGDVWE